MPTVSVIVTILNERASIARLLDSLASQSRLPDEIVIVDGGSRDGTVELLRARIAEETLPLHVLVRPGANISQGRNVAIEAARSEVIAATDAGVQLAHDWLRALVAPFDDEQVHVVSGVFVPDTRTTFEVAMGATVLPALSELSPDRFLPSSRSVAYRKSAWQAVGGYPEWLDYCEDLVYDLALRARFGTFAFAPQAVVRFRPRGNLRAFWRQYYRYARGDGKADLWRVRHAVRYLTYLVLAPALVALSIAHSPLWLVLLALGVALYTMRPYQRLSRAVAGLSLVQKLYAIALVPCIRVAGDLAKMAGYPAGWVWRLRHQDAIPASQDRENAA